MSYNISDRIQDTDFLGTCRNNIGRIVTVFTECGGACGCGFTGLLAEVDCHFIKLITSAPNGPISPFGGFNGNDRDDCECNLHKRNRRCDASVEICCENHRKRNVCDPFGTVAIIPIDKIVSFVFNTI